MIDSIENASDVKALTDDELNDVTAAGLFAAIVNAVNGYNFFMWLKQDPIFK